MALILLNLRPSAETVRRSDPVLAEALDYIQDAFNRLYEDVVSLRVFRASPQSPASSGTFVDAETPVGPIDGSNRVFTLARSPNPPASLLLTLNGIVQQQGSDYTLSGAVITYAEAPQPGDTHKAWYRV